MDNVGSGNERDISLLGRGFIGPDATLTSTSHSIASPACRELVLYPKLRRPRQLGGLHNSQRVLLALTQAGASREDSSAMGPRNAMKTGRPADFLAASRRTRMCRAPSPRISRKFDDASI